MLGVQTRCVADGRWSWLVVPVKLPEWRALQHAMQCSHEESLVLLHLAGVFQSVAYYRGWIDKGIKVRGQRCCCLVSGSPWQYTSRPPGRLDCNYSPGLQLVISIKLILAGTAAATPAPSMLQVLLKQVKHTANDEYRLHWPKMK